MKKLTAILFACLLLSGCKVSYSFSGTSIQPDVNTITIGLFEYRALKVNPSLSNMITEELKTKFRRMTRLEQVDYDGDLEIQGAITGYEVRATAITAQDEAAQNRLTITVSINFISRKYPDEGFENKTFTSYADFDATTALDAVESTLCMEIIDKINEDIFNATVAQW